MVPALLEVLRLLMATVRAGRVGKNLRENNEGEEQIHSPKCGGSHLV